MRIKPQRGFYIPKGARKIQHKHSSAVLYAYEAERGGKPAFLLIGFSGRRQKPDFHYRLSSEENREAHANEFFAAVASREGAAKDRRAKPHSLAVGDVLRSSWGYDQTNVDYYQVVGVIGKSMVEIREIGQMAEEDGAAAFSGHCVPAIDDFKGPAMRKRADGDSVKIASYAWARKMEPNVIAGVKVYEKSYWSSYA